MPATYRLIILGLIAILLCGCSALIGTPVPTALPTDYVPTAIALTVEASGVNLSSSEPASNSDPEEARATLTPRPTPASTPTPTSPTPALGTKTEVTTPGTIVAPAEIPFAAIQIINPGPASRVTSPFLMKASVMTGPAGIVRIELLGEDGRLLMREVKNYSAAKGRQVGLGVEMVYAISAAAEAGRLQVGVEDEFGRLMSLGSTDLILLSLGELDVNPTGDLLEDIFIESPAPKSLIQGGTVRVSGLARPHSDQPLRIELQMTDGKIVGTRQIAVSPNPGSTHGTFAVDVPYSVSSPTRIRLVVWERGDRIPDIIHLSSVEVMLSP